MNGDMNAFDTRVIDEVELANDIATWSAATSPTERVSIYLPTHRAGREVTQDPVLFRRLVATAA
jgi:hypothetical protein